MYFKIIAQKYGQYGPGMAAPDMSEVKESVKEGVSKVAGRLSGMASGVMTQLQVSWAEIFLRLRRKLPLSKIFYTPA